MQHQTVWLCCCCSSIIPRSCRVFTCRRKALEFVAYDLVLVVLMEDFKVYECPGVHCLHDVYQK